MNQLMISDLADLVMELLKRRNEFKKDKPIIVLPVGVVIEGTSTSGGEPYKN